MMQARAGTEGGAGIGSRKEDPRSGEDRRNPPSPPGRIKEAQNGRMKDNPPWDMKDNPYGCNKLNSFVNHHRGCIRILFRGSVGKIVRGNVVVNHHDAVFQRLEIINLLHDGLLVEPDGT